MKRLIFCALCVTLLVASLGAENANKVTPYAGLTINERAGTFSVYLISVKGQRVPLFDESSGLTGFYLTADDTSYPLLGGAGVTTTAANTQGGGFITYSLKDLADVTVEFSFAASDIARPEDMVRVDVRVLNTSGKQQTFAVNGLFDTILGESDASFFSTLSQDKISTEFVIDNIASHQWVKGEDNGNAMRFILFGDGITSPRTVNLASLDKVYAVNGNKEYSAGRTFSSNNGAVDIRWDPLYLQKDQTGGITFYLFLGSGDAPPPAVLAALNKANPDLVAPGGTPPPGKAVATAELPRVELPKEEPVIAKAPPEKKGTYIQPPTPTHTREAPRAEYPRSPAPQFPEAELPTSPVVIYVAPPTRPAKPAVTTDNSTDADYAKDLFDRIQRLGSGPGGVNGINREEIIRLNDELDRFLARIGQKG